MWLILQQSPSAVDFRELIEMMADVDLTCYAGALPESEQSVGR